MNYPTMAEVEAATRYQLLRWTRYLPSPDDEHRPILERIMARQKETGGITPELSKKVGWDG